MESVGAELNAYTTKEETMLYAIAPSRYARRSLHMILDIAAHSTFPEREWAKEQEVILDEIHSYEDSPSELIFDEFEDQVFPSAPPWACHPWYRGFGGAHHGGGAAPLPSHLLPS